MRWYCHEETRHNSRDRAGAIVPLTPDAAADPTPLLRIEAGAHVAASNDAATDPDGRVLVTASNDKTARVWSLPDLRPIGVLRPPIGPDEQGRVYAVAVSPDRRLTVLGGWGAGGDHAVLVFDLRTRQVVRRLGGLPNVINALAISRDGTRLAAGLWGANGVRVWRLADGASLWDDPDYRDSVYGLDFAPDGRLAAASYDGAVRLYDPAGRLLGRAETEAARRPYRIRFTPDGALLALGFADAVALEVRDGATLALRHRPDVTGLSGDALAPVGWSADGRTLYAGGAPRQDGGRPVFAWAEGGAGPHRIAAAGFGDNPAAILPLTDGRLAFTSLSGDIAVVGRDGARVAERRSGAGNLNVPSGDLAAPSWRLRLARDGATVEWVFFDAPDRWLRFDAALPDLASAGAPLAGLADWSEAAPGLRITGWNATSDPRLNGRPLTLRPYERARSVAVAPGRVLLGADWFLRLFDAEARALWQRSVPDEAWRVNLSPDGRLAVAALADGTIRWYRARDGRELLALFVTPDARRWVAFTPSGLYAASPGGEDLIGWHINRGPDRAADFFPAAQFRDRFYRPDVITRVLATLDEDEAVWEAEAALGAVPRGPPNAEEVRAHLPPVATILEPEDGAAIDHRGAARLRVLVRSPSGAPVGEVRVLADALPLETARPVGEPVARPPPAPGETEEEHTFDLDLSAFAGGAPVIEVAALAGERIGVPARVLLRVAAPPAVAPVPRKPMLYGVVAGVTEYAAEGLRLRFAADDARALAAALRRQKGGLYRDVELRELIDADVTRTSLIEALQWLEQCTARSDTAILYLAGHGVSPPDGRYYFLPHHARPETARAEGVSSSDLVTSFGQMHGRVLLFLDTCHAGALAGYGPARPADVTDLVNELLAQQIGVAAFSATTGTARAEERDELGHGVFTHVLLQALEGAAAPGGGAGELRILALADVLSREVERITAGKQTPAFTQPYALPDEPIFLAGR